MSRWTRSASETRVSCLFSPSVSQPFRKGDRFIRNPFLLGFPGNLLLPHLILDGVEWGGTNVGGCILWGKLILCLRFPWWWIQPFIHRSEILQWIPAPDGGLHGFSDSSIKSSVRVLFWGFPVDSGSTQGQSISGKGLWFSQNPLSGSLSYSLASFFS